jgi:hypothetical protein
VRSRLCFLTICIARFLSMRGRSEVASLDCYSKTKNREIVTREGSIIEKFCFYSIITSKIALLRNGIQRPQNYKNCFQPSTCIIISCMPKRLRSLTTPEDKRAKQSNNANSLEKIERFSRLPLLTWRAIPWLNPR